MELLIEKTHPASEKKIKVRIVNLYVNFIFDSKNS